MTTTAVKITRKGQVTIPKEIRARLQATAVYFEVVGDTVVVRAVRDAAGSLKDFAGKAGRTSTFKTNRNRAWEEAVREKSRK